jgi:hypothetical protein
MAPDIEKYRQFVDGFDLSEEEKIELIHTIWNVMESFADRAFGLNSAQQAIALRDAKSAFDGGPVLELKAEEVGRKSIKPTFERKA